jgi:accessory gene regulator protein AgrB
MKKRIRLFLAILILSISIALLVWGYAPNPRETRAQPIVPAEMQLPAP